MLDPDALGRLRRLADDIERRSDRLRGLYGVGSLALGDWTARLSNVDAVAVADDPWPATDLDRLRPAVRGAAVHRRPARVAWVTWDDLAEDPRVSSAPVRHGSRPVATGELVNAMTWHVLRSEAVCVRGPEYPQVWSGDVRDWAEERLRTWWPPQLARWRRRPTSLWWRRQINAPVLEAARLSVIVGSGRVLSKLEAGESLIDGARTSIQHILKDSVGYRQGVRWSMYWGPFERKNDALNWVGSVIAQNGGAARQP